MKSLLYMMRVVALQLRHALGRTVLTVLAVALAVALFVTVVGFATAYRSSLSDSVRNLGYEVLVTVKGCPYETSSLVLQGGNIPMFVNESIFREVYRDPHVARATRFLMRAVPDVRQGRIRVYMGVDEAFFPMKPWLTLQQGAWFQSRDSDEAVLGYGAAERLRMNVGDAMEVVKGQQPLRIVGILDRCGGQDDGTIFLPLARAQRLFDRKDQLSGIGVKLKSLDSLETFAERINTLPSVQVISLPQVQTTIFRLLRTGTAFALAASAVAMLVALISVMNAILMSVLQRSRQIAVMRALGASDREVVGFVALESLVYCVVGGAAGILLAAVCGGSVSALLASVLPFAPESVYGGLQIPTAASAMAGAIGLGLAASLYPGARARRIAPAIAMRD